MSIDAVKALRSHLQANAALSAFFITHYGKAATHLIGYKRTQNANDFPFICYVVPRSEIGDVSGERVTVSVVIGVNNPDITDDVFDGVARVNEAARLIIDAIAVGTLDAVTIWLGEATLVSDMGYRHPFYEIELILPLLWRG